MDSKRIEGLWDCSSCGQKGILARFDRCKNCGRARGAETIFYMPSDTAAATLGSDEAAKTTNAPDWLCNYCGCMNRADKEECQGCGAGREVSTHNYGNLHAGTAGASFEQTLAEHESAGRRGGILRRLSGFLRKQ